MSRIVHAALAITLLSLLPAIALGSQSQMANLRGYGRVSAALSPNRAVFTCESPAKADVLLGKMLADIFWDAGAAQTTHTYLSGRRRVLLHDYPPYGSMIAARIGSRVVVLGGDSDQAVLRLASRERVLQSAGVAFEPKSPYPVYLDMYDLRSIQFYTNEMSSPYGYGLGSHWAFIKKFGLGGISFGNFGFGKFSPAPGAVNWSPIDYEIRSAQIQRGMVIPGFDCSGQMPLWMWNADPHAMMQPSPTALMGAWSGLPACSAPFESWGMPAEEQQNGPLWFLRAVMARYGANPAVGGWHIYAGTPGVEMGFHDRSTEFWDFSPAGEQSFRNWLRDNQKLTLPELGLRWHGNPGYYRAWSEVSVPDPNSFFGDLDRSCLLLSGTWQWHDADSDVGAPPAPNDSGWVSYAAPPSEQLATFPWKTAYLRKSFNARDWLAKSNGSVYLVCDLDERSSKGAGVWLNGVSLGSFHPQNGDPGAFAVDVTHTLKAGDNELMLCVPDEGKSLGPIFLTRTKPAAYPYLGAERDAQFVDFKRWQADCIVALHDTVFRTARSLDPNRPMILSTGDIQGLADQVGGLATRYNLGVQMTGREAWYFPWWAGLGYVDDFYGTSEPSGTPQGASLDRMLGWIMIDGDSSDTLCWTLEDFIKRERETGWFTKNQRELQLFGKSLRAKPSIALLHSVQTTLLGDQAPMQWDIGRGELQSAHFDNVYVTEREVENGKVDGYPVLFDCGSEIMDSELVKSIRRYVEAGGTYIALHNTGRHGFTDPDSYPISELTGLQPTGAGKSGTITFGSNPPVLRGWAGRSFTGWGFALDPRNSAQSGVIPLARWQDGTIAVGYRSLGKGRVIYLGSTFWHDDKVESGFFDQLFTDLGVERNADAGSASVWARKYITKNGLQSWLIAANEDSKAQTTDLKLRVDHRPNQVLDILTKQPVPFEYTSDGWVHIAHVDYAPYGLRVFGVQRATLVGGLSTWWGEKTKYWSIRTPDTAKPPALAGSPTAGRTIPFNWWKFLADRDGSISKSSAWAGLGFNDSRWRRVETGPWQIMSEPYASYRGTGLYRASFKLPARWQDKRILLGLYSFNAPIVYGTGDFFVNGIKVTTYNERGWNQTLRYDITGLLRPGANVLAIRVSGGRSELNGLTGAVWLAPERKLVSQIDLTGQWTAVGGNYVSTREEELPGQLMAKYVWRDLWVPSLWSDKNVFLRIKTPNQWLSMIMVNGHAIADDIYAHNFGTIADINISPYLHAGADNRIELWPYTTLVPRYGPDPQKSDEGQMTFTSIAVGYAQ